MCHTAKQGPLKLLLLGSMDAETNANYTCAHSMEAILTTVSTIRVTSCAAGVVTVTKVAVGTIEAAAAGEGLDGWNAQYYVTFSPILQTDL